MSCRSTSLRPCLRQLSEHQRTESQLRAQTLRQVMVRPHRAQGLHGRGGRATPLVCPRGRHTEQERTARRHPLCLLQASPGHGSKFADSTEEVTSERPSMPPPRLLHPRTRTNDDESRGRSPRVSARDLVTQLVTQQRRSSQIWPLGANMKTAPDLRFRRSGAVSYWWAILGLNQ